MHSRVSDGTDSPEELLQKVREKGIDLFALSDHDDFKGCKEIISVRSPDDPLFLTGVEFSCKDEYGKYHILGYNFDPNGASIKQVVDLGHTYRINKVKARLDFIANEYGFTFPDEELEALFKLDNPGKPHIGNLMVKYGYAPNKKVAIEEYIDNIHFKSEYVRPEEAISGILGSGGLPILAHPIFGDGDQLVLGDELEERVVRLKASGLLGLEGYYSGFSPKLRDEAIGLAGKYGMYITAGSDYHGTNKLVILGDNGLDDIAFAPDGLRRFLEKVGLTEYIT